MLVHLQKHDGVNESIEVISFALAREMAESLDWDSESYHFEYAVEFGGEAFMPSIAFTNDCGRTLEFGPNSDGRFWLSYRYEAFKSTFGFTSLVQEKEQLLPACELETALNILEKHYGGRHQNIVAVLPTPASDDELENE